MKKHGGQKKMNEKRAPHVEKNTAANESVETPGNLAAAPAQDGDGIGAETGSTTHGAPLGTPERGRQ